MTRIVVSQVKPVKKNFIYVAAYNAPTKQKALADYICDGVQDEVQIQAAITQLSENGEYGGTVILSTGQFLLNGTVTGISNIKLVGEGMGQTIVIQLANTQIPTFDFQDAIEVTIGFFTLMVSSQAGDGILVGSRATVTNVRCGAGSSSMWMVHGIDSFRLNINNIYSVPGIIPDYLKGTPVWPTSAFNGILIENIENIQNIGACKISDIMIRVYANNTGLMLKGATTGTDPDWTGHGYNNNLNYLENIELLGIGGGTSHGIRLINTSSNLINFMNIEDCVIAVESWHSFANTLVGFTSYGCDAVLQSDDSYGLTLIGGNQDPTDYSHSDAIVYGRSNRRYYPFDPMVDGCDQPKTLIDRLLLNQVVNYKFQDLNKISSNPYYLSYYTNTCRDYSGNGMEGTCGYSGEILDSYYWNEDTPINPLNWRIGANTNQSIPQTLSTFVIGGVYKCAGTSTGGNRRRLFGCSAITAECAYKYEDMESILVSKNGSDWIDTDFNFIPKEHIMVFMDCNGSTIRTFINGVKVNTINTATTLSGQIYWGNGGAYLNQQLGWPIGWALVLDTSLTDDQHEIIYNQHKALYQLS